MGLDVRYRHGRLGPPVWRPTQPHALWFGCWSWALRLGNRPGSLFYGPDSLCYDVFDRHGCGFVNDQVRLSLGRQRPSERFYPVGRCPVTKGPLQHVGAVRDCHLWRRQSRQVIRHGALGRLPALQPRPECLILFSRRACVTWYTPFIHLNQAPCRGHRACVYSIARAEVARSHVCVLHRSGFWAGIRARISAGGQRRSYEARALGTDVGGVSDR